MPRTSAILSPLLGYEVAEVTEAPSCGSIAIIGKKNRIALSVRRPIGVLHDNGPCSDPSFEIDHNPLHCMLIDASEVKSSMSINGSNSVTEEDVALDI
jgi:hypothetical protein